MQIKQINEMNYSECEAAIKQVESKLDTLFIDEVFQRHNLRKARKQLYKRKKKVL